MSNDVQIRVDSRVLYGLVAIIAVVAIFVVGWFIGQQLTGDTQTAQVPEPAPADVGDPGAAPAVSNPLGDPPVVPPSQSDPITKGSNPVSVDDVPVGPDEPRLWVEELSADNNFTYDMGDIPATQATEKEFVITNAGTGELVIEDASASCGCTAAVVTDPNVGPGETTTVRVAYDPRVNKEQGRYVQKQVRIRSNDPVAPLIEFTISANVASE